MGLFGMGKKHRGHDVTPDDINRDIEEVMQDVHNQPNVRMSHVRHPEDSEQAVWRKGHEENTWDDRVIEHEEHATPHGEPDKPAYAPLFVKINRYRGIISAVGHMKEAVKIVNNSFTVMKELDKVRDQTMTVIGDTIENMEKKITELDNDLIRPTGFNMMGSPSDDYTDKHTVDATVSDLKTQIRQLKGELSKL